MRTINGEKYYRPREAAKLGLITNSIGDKEDSNYEFILKLIGNGKLKAVNYSVSAVRNFWLIAESEINRYNQEFLNGTQPN